MLKHYPKTFVMSDIPELGFLLYKDIQNNLYYISNFLVHINSYYQEKTFELPDDITLIENFNQKSLRFFHPKIENCPIIFIYGNRNLRYDKNFPYPEEFVDKINDGIEKIENERKEVMKCIIS